MRYSSCLDISLPTNWSELTDAHLRYLYFLQSQGRKMGDVINLFFLRLTGLVPREVQSDGDWLMAAPHQLYKVSVGQLAVAVQYLSWMKQPSEVPIGLSEIGGCAAVDKCLHGISFGDYLSLDNYYQGFLAQGDDEDLLAMGQILYPGLKALPSMPERLAILGWVVSLKVFFAHKWSDLFSPSEGGGTADQESLMNAMIRALTGGDVLKEQQVLEDVDTWRALTELNEKAKEAKSIKSSTK